jgi:hypothetical protein
VTSSNAIKLPLTALSLASSPWPVSNSSATLYAGPASLLQGVPSQGWPANSSSDTGSLAHAVSCPAGEHVVSVTWIAGVLPHAPWLVVCSDGSQQLAGVPAAVTPVQASQYRARLTSAPPCKADIVATRQAVCRLGM